MEFLAGEALGALIFFAAFFLAVKYLERRQYTAAKEAVKFGALPWSMKSDEIEKRIEDEVNARQEPESYDPPPGIGRGF